MTKGDNVLVSKNILVCFCRGVSLSIIFLWYFILLKVILNMTLFYFSK